MMREFHSPQAQAISEQVMELAQRFGSDLNQAEADVPKKITKKNRKKTSKQTKFKPAGDFGSFT